jgi:hypothetical protein
MHPAALIPQRSGMEPDRFFEVLQSLCVVAFGQVYFAAISEGVGMKAGHLVDRHELRVEKIPLKNEIVRLRCALRSWTLIETD